MTPVEARRAAQKRYRLKHPEKIRAKNNRYRKKHPEKIREQRRRRLEMRKARRLAWWEAQLAHQDGVCAICRTQKTLVVDHDHETGVVRGLLCIECNSGIGMFKDDPWACRGAASYLEDPPVLTKVQYRWVVVHVG